MPDKMTSSPDLQEFYRQFLEALNQNLEAIKSLSKARKETLDLDGKKAHVINTFGQIDNVITEIEGWHRQKLESWTARKTELQLRKMLYEDLEYE